MRLQGGVPLAYCPKAASTRDGAPCGQGWGLLLTAGSNPWLHPAATVIGMPKEQQQCAQDFSAPVGGTA